MAEQEVDVLTRPKDAPFEHYRDWQVTSAIGKQFGVNVEQSRDLSAREDVAVAEAAQNLLGVLDEEDRRTYFQLDAADRLDNGYGELPQRILQVYGLSAEEVNQVAMDLRTGKENPIPHFRRRSSDAAMSTATLPHFAHLDLTATGGRDTRLRFEPTSMVGYDSAAFPIRSVGITAKAGEPLAVDLDFSYSFWHTLSTELPQHPLVMQALKTEFASIVQRYADNPKKFTEERKKDGSVSDTTQLQGFLFNYLANTYLRNSLAPDEYAAFQTNVSQIVTPWNAARESRTLSQRQERQYRQRYYSAYERGLQRARGARVSVN